MATAPVRPALEEALAREAPWFDGMQLGLFDVHRRAVAAPLRLDKSLRCAASAAPSDGRGGEVLLPWHTLSSHAPAGQAPVRCAVRAKWLAGNGFESGRGRPGQGWGRAAGGDGARHDALCYDTQHLYLEREAKQKRHVRAGGASPNPPARPLSCRLAPLPLSSLPKRRDMGAMGEREKRVGL